METTFPEYIKNPEHNSVYSHKEIYRVMYSNKLDAIMARELGKVKYELFVEKASGRYFVLMRVPSEAVPNFYYETVIEFFAKNDLQKASRSISGYFVKFYSNDPSFVYTFAHSFLKNDIFIRDLVPRMSKEAILTAAKEKNPKNQVGYVKSIYFAYLLMERYKLFDKSEFEVYGKPYSKYAINQLVVHADDKVKSREVEGKKHSEKKKRERKDKAQQFAADMKRAKHSPEMVTKTSPTVGNVHKTKTVKSASHYTKRSKTI